MQVEIYCSHCGCRRVASEATVADVLEQLTREGPWAALGDGETFEDRIASGLCDRGLRCPRCGSGLHVDEQSLGRLAQEVLACW
jgi:hypothetical protein